MASNADLVARAPLYPAPDLLAYVDAIDADLYARAGVYGAPDAIAYPWGTPAFAALGGGSTLTITPDPGALTIGQGTAPTVTVSAPAVLSGVIALRGMGGPRSMWLRWGW